MMGYGAGAGALAGESRVWETRGRGSLGKALRRSPGSFRQAGPAPLPGSLEAPGLWWRRWGLLWQVPSLSET